MAQTYTCHAVYEDGTTKTKRIKAQHGHAASKKMRAMHPLATQILRQLDITANQTPKDVN